MSDVPEALARLIEQYAIHGEVRPYKVYLDEQELFLRWRESLTPDDPAENGLPPYEYVLNAGPERDRYGYYDWQTESLQQEWWSWHIGGRWDGVLQGKPAGTRPTCDCEDWEEHLQRNICRVTDLPPGLWPHIYVTPDSEWHLVSGLRKDQTTDYQGRTFKQLVPECQEYLAVMVDCQVPPQEDTDNPLIDALVGPGPREVDAFVDPAEAADIYAGDRFRAGSPPVVTKRSHLYMWAYSCNWRVRQWRRKRPPASAEELLEWWLMQLQDKLALTTLSRMHRPVRYFLQWYEAQWQCLPTPRELTSLEVISKYAETLRWTATRGTIKTHLQAIQSWGKWLNAIMAPPSTQRSPIKPVKRRTVTFPQPLTDRQLEALVHAAAHSAFPTRDLALLQLLLTTGMHLGDLATLAWQDLHISETHGEVWLRVRMNEGHRVIPLGVVTCQALISYRAALLRMESRLQCLEEIWRTHSPDLPREPLWQRQDRQRLSQRALSRIILELAQATGMIVPPETVVRRLRYSFIHGWLMQSPNDHEGLALILGIGIPTVQRYAYIVSRQLLAERLWPQAPLLGWG